MYGQGEVAWVGSTRLEVVRWQGRDTDGEDLYLVQGPFDSWVVRRDWMARYEWRKPHQSPK